MKKILSAILVCMMLVSYMTLSASAADGLPFEFKAPANVSLYQVYENSHECKIAVGLDTEMQKFFQAASESEDRAAYFAPYGYEDINLYMQMDWALDDVNDSVSGWHYNKYWDWNDTMGAFGQDDEGKYHYSEWDIVSESVSTDDATHDFWVFRVMGNDWRWNGGSEDGTVGVKDQMRPQQYTAVADGDDLTITIDFTQHTFYVRVRFMLVGFKIGADRWNVMEYTDWSGVASFGKDAKTYKPLTAKDLPKPVISNLYMTNIMFNDNPVAAYTITVPDDLVAKATEVNAHGGAIFLTTYMRVKGDTEWTEMGNADRDVKSGEIQVPLLHLVNAERPAITADTPLEVKVRFWCGQSGYDDIESEWSDILVLNTDDINYHTDHGEEGTATPEDPSNPAKKTCPICHFCPQPLGLCIFIWLLILLAVIIVIVVIIIVCRKKKKDENKK
ncbi:MAG: hypothetical protein J6112_05265 [Clostridia bacterium]|nr:hypothetical protein [Clostridia bacterium]